MPYIASMSWFQNLIKLESILCTQLDNFTTAHNLQFEDEAEF